LAKNKDYILLPKGSQHNGTVIFLHGLGDNPAGWSLEMEEIQSRNPHLKFILPCAPIIAVTLNSGMKMTAWHDVRTLDTIDEDIVQLEESKKKVIDIIEKEVLSGTPYNKIILGGFSQGAAMSMYVGYQLSHSIAGVIALSGYLPRYSTFKNLITNEAKNTPLLICHGDKDQVVHFPKGDRAQKILQDLGVPTQFEVYKNMVHSSSPEELSEVEEFLVKQLPPKSTL